MYTRFRNIGVIIVFLILLYFPIVNNLGGFIKDVANLENRKMARQPPFDIEHLDPYPPLFEKFYNDYFTLRSRLIKWFNDFNLVVFKKSPFPDRVIVGNNGWLFLGVNDIDTYQGKHRFSESELEAFKLELEFRRDAVERNGGKFYFLIAPAKANVYSEQVPYTFYRYNTESWAEQLINYLHKNSTIITKDLLKPLLAHKSNQLYYKIDTHWNDLGAYYAANEFCEMVSQDFKLLPGHSFDEYTISDTLKTDGNCAQILGFPKMYQDVDYRMKPKFALKARQLGNGVWQTPGHEKPRTIIAGDSFCNWFLPFVKERFGTTIYAFDYWEYKFDEKQVIKEKPQVYLLIIHEPLLRGMLNHQARLLKDTIN
jgi:hypothetical protein